MDHAARRIAAVQAGTGRPGRFRPGLALFGAVTLTLGILVAPILLATSDVSAATPHATTSVTPPNTMYVLNDTASSLLSFAPGATGNVAPTSTVSGPTSTLSGPFYAAMDHGGDVWVANNGNNTVIEFTQAELAAGGSPNPVVVLSADATPSIVQPSSLAFDRSGDLWVVNSGVAPSLVEFTPSQLAASGAPTPAVTITGPALSGPASLAIDASGNAWVGNDTSNTIVSYGRGQLNTSGSPTPVVTLAAAAGSINAPDSLAFDRSGRLWVANDVTPGSVVAFSPAQLASSGAPVPAVTLASDGTSIHDPDGLTFDPFGNLWVANFLGNSVAEFSPAQLAASGTPTAVSSLSGASTTLSGPDNALFVPSTGYTLAASDGGIFNYGGSGFFGSTGSLHLNSPIVGMAGSPDGLGYWLVAGDGGIFNFGDAGFQRFGRVDQAEQAGRGNGRHAGRWGYWLVARRRGHFNYGDAKFFGGHGGLAAQPAHRGDGRLRRRRGVLAGGQRRRHLHLRRRRLQRLPRGLTV